MQGVWVPPAGWPERSPLLKGTLNSYTTVWLCHTKLTPKYRDYVAIARSQEGLSPAETVNAYQTIYFPAQKIHFERDCPQTALSKTIFDIIAQTPTNNHSVRRKS